jgi:DNA-binding winged helix-turn-helix (wHTH) protein/TolB-like protein
MLTLLRRPPHSGYAVSAADQQIDLAREAAFTLGAMEVRPATREVQTGDTREVLEPRVMQVLVALARSRGEVVSRDVLIASCWSGRAVGDDAINRCIARIRRLAESHGGFEVETIARVGYRLHEADPDPATVEQRQATTPARPRIPWPFIAAAVAVLGLIAVGFGVAHLLHGIEKKQLVVEAPVRHLIAVLPFTPLSTDADTRLYGDAVASAVAETLSRIGGPVIPPAESFQYRGPAKARAAQALRAMYVIDGEVLRDSGRVRISVRLDDTLHGTTVFARTFEEKAERASALSDRVAAYIAALSWGSDITRWDPSVAPAILRAFEQQERGDLFAAYVTGRELAKAHPDNPDIQRIYAFDVVNLVYASVAKRKLSLVEEAREAGRNSIRKGSRGEGYAALAATTPHFLWAEREGYLRKALEISPDSVGVAEYLTWFLNDTGRFRDAEPWARSAYERFPYHPVSFERRINQLLGANNSADALEIIARARRLWPENQQFLSQAFEASVFMGTPAQSEALLNDADVQTQLPPATLALWRDIARALRRHKAADIAAVSRDCREPGDNWWSCMVTFSMLGRLDDAYRIADRIYIDQRGSTPDAIMQKWLANDELQSTRYLFIPATAAMRRDPRFRELVDRVGLLPYWSKVEHAPDFCAAETIPVCRLLKSS